MHLNSHWRYLPGNENCDEPKYVILDYIHHFLPRAKIIIIFRDPVERYVIITHFETHETHFSTICSTGSKLDAQMICGKCMTFYHLQCKKIYMCLSALSPSSEAYYRPHIKRVIATSVIIGSKILEEKKSNLKLIM